MVFIVLPEWVSSSSIGDGGVDRIEALGIDVERVNKNRVTAGSTDEKIKGAEGSVAVRRRDQNLRSLRWYEIRTGGVLYGGVEKAFSVVSHVSFWR